MSIKRKQAILHVSKYFQTTLKANSMTKPNLDKKKKYENHTSFFIVILFFTLLDQC